MSWRPGDPRFVVRETEGWPIGKSSGRAKWQPLLSVSVLDAAYLYREVARFNQEDVRFHGNQTTTVDVRATIRARATGLAAILEAEHAA